MNYEIKARPLCTYGWKYLVDKSIVFVKIARVCVSSEVAKSLLRMHINSYM